MRHGFVRVGAVSPSMKVADCSYNADEIIRCVKNHESQVQYLVFPELSITGYTCGDLFFQKALTDSAFSSLERILEETKYTGTVFCIGMPLAFKNKLYNTAVVIQSGMVLGVVPKKHLPNYSEFYEKRWFCEGEGFLGTLSIAGKEVPFGTDLVFTSGGREDVSFAVEICEDLWAPVPPSSHHTLAGAHLVFNLSASNDIVGKYEYRKKLVEQQSSRSICGYIYASANCNESTTDLVFGGHTFICENGRSIVEGRRFSFEEDCIITEIDVDIIKHDRKKCTVYENGMHLPYTYVKYRYNDQDIPGLTRFVNPSPFVPDNEAAREERCKEIFNIQSCGLAKRIRHVGTDKVVVGISGGLDSTLALLVCAEAFDKLGLDRQGMICVTMPGFGTTGRTYENAVGLIRSVGGRLIEVDITKACLGHFEDIGHDQNVHDLTFENAQARERTQILMDISTKENALMVGTGDLSELALGWCTYNGDHMSMYSVNCSIPKTLVRYLIDYVANYKADQHAKEILDSIIDTPISPELLPPVEGEIVQVTEDILGPYELHDFFLYQFLRFGFPPGKILYLATHAFRNAYTPEEIKKWLQVFVKRFFSQQFKRSCMPDGPKVGSVSLSPRGDWRMPSDVESGLWAKEIQ
ncbi:MAG: NAD(+) synthase [Clostridia bacterium]